MLECFVAGYKNPKINAAELLSRFSQVLSLHDKTASLEAVFLLGQLAGVLFRIKPLAERSQDAANRQ